MAADLIFVNISGTRLGMTGSQAISLVVLCGVSGNSVIPLACRGDGILLTSGPQ